MGVSLWNDSPITRPQRNRPSPCKLCYLPLAVFPFKSSCSHLRAVRSRISFQPSQSRKILYELNLEPASTDLFLAVKDRSQAAKGKETELTFQGPPTTGETKFAGWVQPSYLSAKNKQINILNKDGEKNPKLNTNREEEMNYILNN